MIVHVDGVHVYVLSTSTWKTSSSVRYSTIGGRGEAYPPMLFSLIRMHVYVVPSESPLIVICSLGALCTLVTVGFVHRFVT